MDDLNTQAQALADLYTSYAEEVRTYKRAHFDELQPAERTELDGYVQQFEDMHDRFAAQAIAASLQQVEAQLDSIKSVTQQACDEVKNLKKVQQVTQIAAAVLGAASCAAAGDYGGAAGQLVGAVKALAASKDDTAATEGASGN
jgi:hypothetical protein